jgi:hypothetical protein
MYSDETIKLYIPKDLIIEEDEHPEEYGDVIIVLKNKMWTDAYIDDEGNYYSYTNDVELIDYVNKCKMR